MKKNLLLILLLFAAQVQAEPIDGFPQSVPSSTGKLTANIQPVGPQDAALETAAYVAAYTVASDAVEAGSTATVINATGHAARRGDVVRFTSGTYNRIEVRVTSTNANDFTLASTLSGAPSGGDTFDILRPVTLRTDNNGVLEGGSVQYAEDSAHNSGDSGTLALVVRSDTRTSLCDNGDNCALQINSASGLWTAHTWEDGATASVGDEFAAIGGQVNEDFSALNTEGKYTWFAVRTDGQAMVDDKNEVVTISVTPTIDNANDYAIDDNIGGVMTFANAFRASIGTGKVKAITLGNEDANDSDLRKQISACFYHSSPAGTFTDNNPTDPTDADIAGTLCGCVQLNSHYYWADNGYSRPTNDERLPLPCGDGNDTSLYVALNADEVIGGGTGFSATDALTLTIWVEQD